MGRFSQVVSSKLEIHLSTGVMLGGVYGVWSRLLTEASKAKIVSRKRVVALKEVISKYMEKKKVSDPTNCAVDISVDIRRKRGVTSPRQNRKCP